ncbi:MAG TPA: adenylate/guanylate cyclase domain-containing protein [Candidatus Koribacter sp.]
MFRPTLKQIFTISLIGLTAALALLYYVFFKGSERTILQSADRFRNAAGHQAADRVLDSLDTLPRVAAEFEGQMHYGQTDPRNANSVESGLLALLIANESLSEASFTYARGAGFERGGNLRIAPGSAGEVSVSRTPGKDQITSTRTWFEHGKFVAESHPLPSSAGRPGEAVVPDPTSHLTFQVPSSRDHYGSLLWTDLHWSQLDENLPEEKRRVEVSVQKAINDPMGHFAGVLRLGLSKNQIDRAVALKLSGAEKDDPHLVFLCDSQGRLIAGPGMNRVVESGDDLRIATDNQQAAIVASLKLPMLKTVDSDHPTATTSFVWESNTYLVTYYALEGTQDWIVGVVVPRSYYLRGLARTREIVLLATLALIAAIILVGGYVLRRIHGAHAQLVRETSRMKQFEFTPSAARSRLRDVDEVLDQLERAKTAMRAMGKYVPLDLVRRLYAEGREPELGGEAVELSILFTDIKNFTTFSEKTEPHRLAEVLGLYLETLSHVIQKEKGTIDKYIGDAVMAFWNAPETVKYHPLLACHAALNSVKSLEELYASPRWGGMPKFTTRFGLHRDTVSVGHFGSTDRFNYTAIGDGVNLASRLEGLNKQYGTTIIVSQTVYELVYDHFDFRKLDRVSVKGKSRGVQVYELLGEKSATVRPEHIVRYEEALELYAVGDFAAALKLFEISQNDIPSMLMAGRCREFLVSPPAQWDGTFVAKTK